MWISVSTSPWGCTCPFLHGFEPVGADPCFFCWGLAAAATTTGAAAATISSLAGGVIFACWSGVGAARMAEEVDFPHTDGGAGTGTGTGAGGFTVVDSEVVSSLVGFSALVGVGVHTVAEALSVD